MIEKISVHQTYNLTNKIACFNLHSGLISLAPPSPPPPPPPSSLSTKPLPPISTGINAQSQGIHQHRNPIPKVG